MGRPEDEFGLIRRMSLRVVRWGKYAALRRSARIRAARPVSAARVLPVRYIVGCGRSGTTILARALAKHPRACFVYEPYHLWERIDTRADMTAFHSPARDKLVIMDAEHADPAQREVYRRLIGAAGHPRRHDCVIEKTPINACRIGWIEQLEDDARYVHIVRNGLAVAASIERIVLRPTYRLATRPNYHQWWGEDMIKWHSLAEQGERRGYGVGCTHLLESHLQRGAYEWIVSLSEVDRWRSVLGDRLLELTLTELTGDPATHIGRIAAHFGLDPSGAWLDRAAATIERENRAPAADLVLPQSLADAFNGFQDRYGFAGKARAA
ncbi:MAG: sulfotransferase [Planctomycetota bacterium]|nr:MAG: sulfotransferase [Planctomycetota bacterium]